MSIGRQYNLTQRAYVALSVEHVIQESLVCLLLLVGPHLTLLQ